MSSLILTEFDSDEYNKILIHEFNKYKSIFEFLKLHGWNGNNISRAKGIASNYLYRENPDGTYTFKQKECVKLENMKCSDCKHYRNLYIHPWSEGVSDEVRYKNGFACILPNNEKFIESFNGWGITRDDLRIDAMIGRADSVGCEMFDKYEGQEWKEIII